MTTSIARSLSRWLACAAVTAATAAGLPFVPSASAADMPAQARPAVVAAAPLWTGFYIGIHGGGGWVSTHLSDPSLMVFFETKIINSSGPLAGVQVGANWQFGNVVVGGEIDASWASLKGSVAPGRYSFLSGYDLHFRALATGTGRVGYAAGAWLSYVKAGIAWADLEQTNRRGDGNSARRAPYADRRDRRRRHGMGVLAQSVGQARIQFHLFRRELDHGWQQSR